MAKLTKRILYTPSNPCIQGYMVEDENGKEFPIEYDHLIARMKDGSLHIENARTMSSRYGSGTILQGVKGAALTKLPKVYVFDVIKATGYAFRSNDKDWEALRVFRGELS